MFTNREQAGRQLASALRGLTLENPIVLAIPRGGVTVGAALARELGAELDVVLSRKLHAPEQPELAIGAVSEDGQVYLNPLAEEVLEFAEEYLAQERQKQLAEIRRRREVFRSVRPQAELAGRTVIVTDDGIATGATMIAALHWVRTQSPREVIVAVPVASPDRLTEIASWCDRIVCLLQPEQFWAVGQFYEDFAQVDDEQAVALLRQYQQTQPTTAARASATGQKTVRKSTGSARN